MHWFLHLIGADNGNSHVYLALSGVVSVVIGGGAVWGWMKTTARHHRERLAQAARHHREQQEQARLHHEESQLLARKHHNRLTEQAQQHHEALKAHITGTNAKGM